MQYAGKYCIVRADRGRLRDSLPVELGGGDGGRVTGRVCDTGHTPSLPFFEFEVRKKLRLEVGQAQAETLAEGDGQRR